MILSRRVALDGAQLDEIDSRVVLQSVKTGAGKNTITAVSLYGRDGQRVTGAQRDTIDVEIEFGLLIRKEEMAARAELLDTVNAWAAAADIGRGGAWLTVGHKENRRMRVVLAEPADEGDLREWNRNFRITFRAYGVPYWQETEPTARISGETAMAWSGQMTVGGNVRTAADVSLTNGSGALLNTAAITVGSNIMRFEELGLAANETLVIDHDETGTIRIRIRSAGGVYRSALAARTTGSDDRFSVLPGTAAASFRSERACRMTVGWRCRYL